MKYILEPYWIASECYLSEALSWAAYRLYPKQEIIPDWCDARFDKHSRYDISPTLYQGQFMMLLL